jgi:hypothetical protein
MAEMDPHAYLVLGVSHLALICHINLFFCYTRLAPPTDGGSKAENACNTAGGDSALHLCRVNHQIAGAALPR